jgi:hypothetical protein
MNSLDSFQLEFEEFPSAVSNFRAARLWRKRRRGIKESKGGN